VPALFAAWSGLAAVAFAVANLTLVPFEYRLLVMLIWAFTDALPLTLGLMVLWAFRKQDRTDAAIEAQRMQARAGIGLALLALGLNCAYLLWSYLAHVRPHLPE
jgi:hypothetical protein